MKRLIFILICLSTFYSKGQIADNTRRKNERNIYYQALTQYISSESKNGRILDSIYIEEDGIITDSLLLKSGSTIFVILSIEKMHELLRSVPDLVVYKLFPLSYAKKYFSIGFVPFHVTKGSNANDLTYGNGGSCHVFFKYKNYKFIFQTVECYGI